MSGTLQPAAHPASTPAPPALPARWRVVLGTALGYLLVAAATVAVNEPPVYVCPVYPAAGLALAAAIVFGLPALAGVWLGATLLGLIAAALGFLPAGSTVLQWAAITAGATLQAWVGRELLRRCVSMPLSLNTPRSVLRAGLLGGLLASAVSPTVGVAAQWMAGGPAIAGALHTWWAWWLADATGVLLFAPVVLCFLGQPAADWRPRRRSVAVPLLLALLLLVVSTLAFERLQAQRAMATFERDAARLANAAEGRLQTPVLALRALHSAVLTNHSPDAMRLQQATDWWLTQPYPLQAMGVTRYVGPADPTGTASASFADQDRLVVQQVQPLPDYQPLLGQDIWALPAIQSAVRASRATGQPAASMGAALRPGTPDETAVVLHLALYDGQPSTEAARLRQFSGTVFLTLSAQAALRGLRDPDLQHLDWCLLGSEDGAQQQRRLAGPPGCEKLPFAEAEVYQQQRRLMLADRAVNLRISSQASRLPGAQSRSRWVVPVVGLLSSSLLGALLLTITGQSRRTAQAVQDRTAELRLEMTEREQAQEALHASEERMRAIVENLPLGIALVDQAGLLLECNPRLCGMLGRSTEHLRGTPAVNCFDASEEERIRTLRSSLINRHGTVDSVESLKLRAANGRLTDVRVVASALYDANDRLTLMVAVVEDMTAHHQLVESELALNRAEAASRAKSEFVSRMSHELRTPLNAMIGFAQLLGLNNQPALAPRQLEWTQQIQRAGWHLLAMINDTLDLARIESGATRLNLEAVALSPLLDACRDWVLQSAAQRSVQLKVVLGPEVPAVLADSTRLKQVLTNLLSNAVKYNREAGSVEIRARGVARQQVEITVADTGLGMTSEQMSSLFQPYNRLGRESSTVEGTGIGLVISRRLAELMGGTLRAQSVPGQGSVFTLCLPATDNPAPHHAQPEQAGPARYQQRLVHYVEDNATNVEVMRGVLLQRNQITLQTSTLGLDGLSAIRHSRPDLILLDMQLPDISGLELLRHIKQDDQIANIPVIVVSADATPQNMERALTLGAKHYVTKPLDVAAFLVLVDEALANNGLMH